ncbi:MAG: LURP-one-related family protein [Methanospirillum sp.]
MTAIEWATRLFGHGGVAGRAPPSARKFLMRERLASIGDDFPIEDEEGELAFSVDGTAARVRHTLIVRDPNGTELYRIPERTLHLKNVMEIERDGRRAATVGRTKVGTVRERWTVTIPDGETLELRGGIPNHEYRVEVKGRELARVSTRWFRAPDTYGVSVLQGEDEALILTIAAAVDLMAR